jgi:hypothetical protein
MVTKPLGPRLDRLGLGKSDGECGKGYQASFCGGWATMENTYTYTARNPDNPAEVVTFTLYDHSLGVGLGAPLEHVERAVEAVQAARTEEEGVEPSFPVGPWLKPTAIALLERGTHPFNVNDVDASLAGDELSVRAWLRTGGLRVAPLTLLQGRVDNPLAAEAFVDEVSRRRDELPGVFKVAGVFDYWVTWFLTGALAVVLFQLWRQKRGRDTT